VTATMAEGAWIVNGNAEAFIQTLAGHFHEA
jgi:hypothetical protein